VLIEIDSDQDVNLKTFIGRGSGETIQMSFSGSGWLLIQPSEGRVAVSGSGGAKGARQPARRGLATGRSRGRASVSRLDARSGAGGAAHAIAPTCR
jgi:hypothetical protein